LLAQEKVPKEKGTRSPRRLAPIPCVPRQTGRRAQLGAMTGSSIPSWLASNRARSFLPGLATVLGEGNGTWGTTPVTRRRREPPSAGKPPGPPFYWLFFFGGAMTNSPGANWDIRRMARRAKSRDGFRIKYLAVKAKLKVGCPIGKKTSNTIKIPDMAPFPHPTPKPD